ncbi:MAG: acyl-CoA dehydrogenase family protein [Acidimicrobiales bacterium]
MVTGRITWCQLFSEPGNGSDLAGLTTRAERDGDEWVVNGQKLWTTGAHTADYGMLLARTDWDQPKHRGITYFAFPMRQDGVEVRGVHQMNRHTSFNEVFLTDARVDHASVVGEVGDGWRGALTTLSYERGLGARATIGSSRVGRTRQEAAAEHEAYNRTYIWYPQRAGRVDKALPSAQANGVADDPIIRQRVAGLTSLDRVASWTVARAAAARAAGHRPGPEGSIAKLLGSEIARRSNATHAAIAGAQGMLAAADADDPVVSEILVSTPAASIAGGTDEIQHNIVGERTLGLPKEPSVDADIPFREVKVNR